METIQPDSEPFEALADLERALHRVHRATEGCWQLNGASMREWQRRVFAAGQTLESARLAHLRELDARPGILPGAHLPGRRRGRIRPGAQGKAFSRLILRRTAGQAAHDMAAALALPPAHTPRCDPTDLPDPVDPVGPTDPVDPGHLPRLSTAFAAGTVSRPHVDAIVKALTGVPDETLRQPFRVADFDPTGIHPDATPITPIDTATPAPSEPARDGTAPLGLLLDGYLTALAHAYDSWDTARIATRLIKNLTGREDDGFDPVAHEKRHLTYGVDTFDSPAKGMVAGTFALDAEAGAWFATAIDHFSRPEPTRTETSDDGTQVTITDTRTPTQRRADAAGHIARLALGAAQAGTQGGEPPRITIHVGTQDFHAARNPDCTEAHGVETHCAGRTGPVRPDYGYSGFRGPVNDRLGTVGPRLLARFACDAVLAAVLISPTGAVLDIGRDHRTPTPTQRRALHARDRGCIIPGCTVPAVWCDAHHVTYWSHDGPTDLDNLALLCPRHHTETHLGTWTLAVRNGIPWARPPAWIDPRRRWLRNTYHLDHDAAGTLGHQLRLDLTAPTDRNHDPTDESAAPTTSPGGPHLGGAP